MLAKSRKKDPVLARRGGVSRVATVKVNCAVSTCKTRVCRTLCATFLHFCEKKRYKRLVPTGSCLRVRTCPDQLFWQEADGVWGKVVECLPSTGIFLTRLSSVSFRFTARREAFQKGGIGTPGCHCFHGLAPDYRLPTERMASYKRGRRKVFLCGIIPSRVSFRKKQFSS